MGPGNVNFTVRRLGMRFSGCGCLTGVLRMSYGCPTDVLRVSYPAKPPSVPQRPISPPPSSMPPKQGFDGQLRLFPGSNASLRRCNLAVRVLFGYSMRGVKKRLFGEDVSLHWEKNPSCRGGEKLDKPSPPYASRRLEFASDSQFHRHACLFLCP